MERREPTLTLEQQVRLMREIAGALTVIVAEREKWLAYVIEHGECYCRNPFRAHIAFADEWVGFHLSCATQWPFIGDKERQLPLKRPAAESSSQTGEKR